MVPGAPIILVGTHCDTKVQDKSMEDLLTRVAKEVGASNCIEVSAKEGTNVEELLCEAVKLGMKFREGGETKVREKRKCDLL